MFELLEIFFKMLVLAVVMLAFSLWVAIWVLTWAVLALIPRTRPVARAMKPPRLPRLRKFV